ncbi:MAG TPA: hypothetical protein VGS19_29725, partial [Streptosporangiaceae bacterium]|nr:hypothetical protein [Streptosporangiaceae bacterium]
MFRPPRLRIPHLLLITVPLAAALLALPATPASADAPHANLDCTFTSTQDISPPITPEFGPFAETTHGLTATATCTGTIDGQTVTGTGTVALSAAGFADCATGSASGTFVLRIPTTGGTNTVTGRFDFTFSNVPGAPATLTGDLT